MNGNGTSLVKFIRARLKEDAAVARAVQSPSPWKAATEDGDTWIVTDADGDPLIYDEGTPGLKEAAHIARHDPARALREVAAIRAILARYEFARTQADVNIGDEQEAWEKIAGALECDVLAVAGIWSDHPDYRQEWRP